MVPPPPPPPPPPHLLLPHKTDKRPLLSLPPTPLQSLPSALPSNPLKGRGMVGLVGSFIEWFSEYGRRKCRSFLGRTRAAMTLKKKKKKKTRSGEHLGGNKFQYDPWSYSLNFDDGIGKNERADSVLVYVLWVKPA